MSIIELSIPQKHRLQTNQLRLQPGSEMYSLSTLYTLISITICCTGLLVQVYEVSLKYFKFITDTKVSIGIHTHVDTPSMSVCFRKSDIMKHEKLRDVFGIKLKRPILNYDWLEYERNMTIRNFFQYSPDVNEVCQIFTYFLSLAMELSILFYTIFTYSRSAI